MNIDIPMKLNPRFDHVGIAVDSIESSSKFYRDIGLSSGDSEIVQNQGVEVLFLHSGETHIELLQPINQESAVAKFLRRRGPGLHHIAFQVDDVLKATEHCVSSGYIAIDKTPRIGAGGYMIAFLHPKSTGGVLIELIQK